MKSVTIKKNPAEGDIIILFNFYRTENHIIKLMMHLDYNLFSNLIYDFQIPAIKQPFQFLFYKTIYPIRKLMVL